MKAAVFIESNQPFAIRDYPSSDPAPAMSLVSLVASGLCGTDIHIWEGAIAFKGPMILGHEFLGRIEAIGEGDPIDCLGNRMAVGDRVIVNVIEPCGTCPLCTTGGAASCVKLGDSLTYTRSPEKPPHLHGGHAEATIAPTRYLHKISDALPTDVVAAFLCAGPTIVRGVAYAGGIHPGEHVVVQGSGPVGLFAVLYAKRLGAKTVTMIGSGSHPLRLELARELGADSVLDIRATTIDERRRIVLSTADNLGADCILEATGNPEAIAEGLALLRLRGRYVWAGQYSDRGAVAIPTHMITFNALQIFGSAQFTSADRAEYLAFLERVPDAWPSIEKVITHRYLVEEVNEAFTHARRGDSIRTIFVKER
jgi:D-arabinose 1-dehydrogenase-like Zn-dependent alcohol dehydrogenase